MRSAALSVVFRFNVARRQATSILIWWLSELQELGVACVTAIAPRLVHKVTLQWGGDRWCSWGPGALEPFELREDAANTRAILVLAESDVLLQTLRFPAAAKSHLDAAVELQLERLLPISPEAALSQWWVARQDAQWISVRAAIARREHVQGLYDRARAVGLHVVRIAAADSGELVGNLLPKRTGARRFHWSAFDKKLLWGAAILALATCAVTAGQWVFERARLNAELERTERLAAQARSISQRLEQESSGVRSLAHELSRADAGDILAHLTERIPSNAWIYDLEIAPAANDGVKIRFDGLVPTATQFVENLEKTHEFRDVRLVSATSAGLGTGKDRIRVTALWEKQ